MSDNRIIHPENTDAKLKIGLIVDSEFASKYLRELAEWAQTQNDLVISHLIINRTGNAPRSAMEDAIGPRVGKTFLDSIRRSSFAWITQFENYRMRGDRHHKDHLTLSNLKDYIPESITITPIASTAESTDPYSAEDIQNVRNLGLDVMIQCIPGILLGQILKSSRLGIIGFQFGDHRASRNGPPGFWEVYFKQDGTGFSLRQMPRTAHGGNLLIAGRFPTRGYFLLNQASLYTKSDFHLKHLLKTIAAAGVLPPAVESEPDPVFALPNLSEQLKYLCRAGFKLASNAIGRLILKKDYRWGLAYANGDWKTLVLSGATKIQNPPNHFLADPFVIREGDRDYCFAEDYDYKTARGFICVYELKATGAERLGDAIAEPFHMSFPYLFRFDSKLYMCPETSENQDIRLYECVKFPLEWKLCEILMSNLSAVDTMIFQHGERWWLFTNIDPTNTDSHFAELFIFYSDNPLGKDWRPHPGNPFLIDSAKGRNAGILFDDQWIYRVSQKQGFNSYGKGFSINKIVVLNESEYSEVEVRSVEPNFFPGLVGCHHFHGNGRTCVFDYLQYTRTDY